MNDKTEETSNATKAWIAARQRPGNWFDVAPEDQIPTDIKGFSRTILHMFQISFAPEIRTRMAENVLDKDFVLVAAQLIQPPGGGQIVRLNEEVRGKVTIRTERNVEKGERIESSDLEHLEIFELMNDEIDCGHFTLLWTVRGFTAIFDFRSGRGKAAKLLQLGSEFLWAAKASLEQGHNGPATDNLFSACELVSKAQLILHQNPAADAKTHGRIKSAINNWGKLGNVERSFIDLFNKLFNARPNARYNPEASNYTATDDDINLVSALIDKLLHQTAPKIPD